MERGKKERGAFYTPEPLARSIVRWAVRSADESVLDPACGDGVFLREASRRLRELGGTGGVTGVEIDSRAAGLASRIPGAKVIHGSFFDAAPTSAFDCIVGNPPYIRYQRFGEREAVAAVLREEGLPSSGLSSAWAPFALLCARRLRPGGRLGLVIPREALFANYGREALVFLHRSFESVAVEPLDRLWFEGALEKVALLKCEGPLGQLKPREEIPSWRLEKVSIEEREAYENAIRREAFVPLSSLARVRLGIVTGDKKFFAPTGDEIERWGLDCVPAVTSSGHLEGVRVSKPDLARLAAEGERVGLVWKPNVRYVRYGESHGVHLRYKCRIRAPWHSLRFGPRPDAFLTYLIHRGPRLAANDAGAWGTNNVHEVHFKEGGGRWLCVAFHNPVTRLAIELLGRVYGGGVLKIEPGDADRIPVPSSPPPGRWEERIDRALRSGARCPPWLRVPGVELIDRAAERLASERLRRPAPARAS